MTERPSARWNPGPSVGGEGSPPTANQLISRAEAAWERNEYQAALADLVEVLARHPDFPDIRNRAGLCRAMLGDPEGALHELDQAVRLNPRYAEAHLNRALILNDLGRFEEAREAIEVARELDGRSGDLFPADLGNRIAVDHAKLGDLYLHADRPQAAVDEYRKGLEVRPGFVDIRSRLAQAYMALGRLEPAADELNRVIEEQPSFLGARIRLGAVLQRMGQTEQAVSEWRRCLEMEPENRRARAYLASVGVRIEEMRPDGGRFPGTGADQEEGER